MTAVAVWLVSTLTLTTGLSQTASPALVLYSPLLTTSALPANRSLMEIILVPPVQTATMGLIARGESY